MADGVVGRGVLLDIPRLRGVDFLESDDVVHRADLEAAEHAAGVRVGTGDILLVVVGPRRPAACAAQARSTAWRGLHPDCLPWLHEREIAVLGSDGISDPMPGLGIAHWPFPIHQIGITAIGLHLIDNMALAGLGERCASEGRGSSCSRWRRCAS